MATNVNPNPDLELEAEDLEDRVKDLEERITREDPIQAPPVIAKAADPDGIYKRREMNEKAGKLKFSSVPKMPEVVTVTNVTTTTTLSGREQKALKQEFHRFRKGEIKVADLSPMAREVFKSQIDEILDKQEDEKKKIDVPLTGK